MLHHYTVVCTMVIPKEGICQQTDLCWERTMVAWHDKRGGVGSVPRMSGEGQGEGKGLQGDLMLPNGAGGIVY
jgi:hypothetical protein